MLGDVADPQLVELEAGELAFHEVIGRWCPLDAANLGRARKPSNSSVVHEQRHEVETDVDAPALGQLGMHAP